MTDASPQGQPSARPLSPEKFDNPDFTAKGEPRARVGLSHLTTLWINTGTLCNIECAHCYIESSPTNDRLVYFSAEDAAGLFDEIAELNTGTTEIGFTGGEPFMNPDMLAMAGDALGRGFEVLILTNAMQPMQRPRIKQGLLALGEDYGERLRIRVSLDHYARALHEFERGAGTWQTTIDGLDWLAQNGFHLSVGGRTCWQESEADARKGYARLFAERCYPVDANDPSRLVLLPEMDETADVPEITEACWGILGVDPAEMMCATSRMAVKRKGEETPVVLPCTLLPFDTAFEMGATLAQSLAADGGMFDKGEVKLNHPHCAKFCVLGGGSCSIRPDDD
ncbi:MAG: radical SAM protein [Hyphomicrobiales bacterium]